MVPTVFVLVYAGMILGRIPRLGLDRTGIALLGAIALLASGEVSLERAVEHVDVRTLALLFGMMVLSAQLRLGGVYSAVTLRVGAHAHAPERLLALLVAVVGPLSAVFTNDVVALAVAPVAIELARVRRLDPVPFLLAVACATNVGSAATLVGNPQNILIGQTLDLSFAAYLLRGGVPAAAGLAVVWGVIALAYRGRWGGAPVGSEEGGSAAAGEAWAREVAPDRPPFSPWQAAKGLGLATLAMALFLAGTWPRELVALTAAALVLTSRRFHSREMLGLVDWQLLVLFVGLFVVNGALADSGLVEDALAWLAGAGVDLAEPWLLFVASIVLSNTVSNVPAVMLLLPVAEGARDGTLLALSSTLAGNLFIVGSIANIIVVEQAVRRGVAIGWRTHARIGVPVTLLTLLLAALALAV
jgi:Na+/H+ antiporter NhaD/arsenite permease-like protein